MLFLPPSRTSRSFSFPFFLSCLISPLLKKILGYIFLRYKGFGVELFIFEDRVPEMPMFTHSVTNSFVQNFPFFFNSVLFPSVFSSPNVFSSSSFLLYTVHLPLVSLSLSRIHERTIMLRFLKSSQTWGFCMDFLNNWEGGMIFYQVFLLPPLRNCKRLREFEENKSEAKL